MLGYFFQCLFGCPFVLYIAYAGLQRASHSNPSKQDPLLSLHVFAFENVILFFKNRKSLYISFSARFLR